MKLYEKIKEFTTISPAPINIGTYLKDATSVCKIYYEMAGIDGIEDFEEAQKKELELDKAMSVILEHWKK